MQNNRRKEIRTEADSFINDMITISGKSIDEKEQEAVLRYLLGSVDEF